MVVTLEPCMMCVGALLHARVELVVFGAPDPRTGCLTSQMQGGNQNWTNHRFHILGGILEEQCSALLKDFFRRRRAEKKTTQTGAAGTDTPCIRVKKTADPDLSGTTYERRGSEVRP